MVQDFVHPQITARSTRQVKDGAVSDIEDFYASKPDIQTLLGSKADQADTYTKEQTNANFYDITETYSKTEINVLSSSICSNAYFIMNKTSTVASSLVNVSSNTLFLCNSTITSNANFYSIS